MAGLLDFLQSASNTVAGNVAGPVDVINAGLGLLGIPVSKAPVGGSEWMKQRGLIRDVPQGTARIAGETAGLLAPTMIVAKAPQIASGINQMVQNAMIPRRLNPETGAIVWHGSPHKFDKFDASKIGTGEGAQAYGHGLYFAESPDVAKAYQTALTHSDDYVDGQLLDSGIPKHFLARILSDESGNVEAARQSLAVLARPGGAKSVADSAKQALKLLDAGERPIVKTIKPEGALYKVDLPDEAIAKMLDWDKPLSQHSKEVQAAVLKINPQLNSMSTSVGGKLQPAMNQSGEDFVQWLGRNHADQLREQGIPGIRYLDGGSRGTGQGTSNFVVFPGNESLLKIFERNGQPVR
jgi:hypothetical protein